MTDYDTAPALLAAANETITTLDAENADLHGEIRTLREQIEAIEASHATEIGALRWAVQESEGRRDTAEMLVADLTRQRDDARAIAVRCGAFDGGAGCDFPAHLEAIQDESVRMPLVDPEGRAFK